MTSIITGQYKAYPLDSLEGLQLNGVLAKVDTLQGRKCLNLVSAPEVIESDGPTFAILEDSNFHNGIIEISLAGTEPEDTAGKRFFGDFVGIAFRIQSDASKVDPKLDPKINPANVAQFECLYFRPGHGFDEDQMARNRTIQYFAYQKYLFNNLRYEYLQQEKLRQEQRQKKLQVTAFPKMYEAYAPIAPKEWFKMRAEIIGTTAKLYVNGAAQPSLIVNDLKLGDSKGPIGLFVERESVAYYADLKVTYYDD